jgi:hypothetical protein
VKRAEHEKALLEAKIEGHRKLLGLEVRAAVTAFHPLGAALTLLGGDHALVEVVLPILRGVTAHLHPDADPEAKLGNDAGAQE